MTLGYGGKVTLCDNYINHAFAWGASDVYQTMHD